MAVSENGLVMYLVHLNDGSLYLAEQVVEFLNGVNMIRSANIDIVELLLTLVCQSHDPLKINSSAKSDEIECHVSEPGFHDSEILGSGSLN
jgi:hypothetical protein